MMVMIDPAKIPSYVYGLSNPRTGNDRFWNSIFSILKSFELHELRGWTGVQMKKMDRFTDSRRYVNGWQFGSRSLELPEHSG